MKTIVPSHQQLIVDIDKYLDKNKMSAWEFGRKYFQDSAAVSRIRQGRNPRLSTVQKIYKIIGSKK